MKDRPHRPVEGGPSAFRSVSDARQQPISLVQLSLSPASLSRTYAKLLSDQASINPSSMLTQKASYSLRKISHELGDPFNPRSEDFNLGLVGGEVNNLRLDFAPCLNHSTEHEGTIGIHALNEETQEAGLDFIALTAEIVSAYVSNNPVPPAELPALIAKMHAAVAGLASGNFTTAAAEVEIEKLTPSQIRKSIRDDGIVSFIDGKSYKTLKRHLSANGLDPRSYRERYGLPADYPMTAPSYAAQRSELARAIGLGRPGAQIERQKLGRKAS